ncbi:MAG: polyhydroxyalkanoate synthesis regulator DNA-binding domain-containing protein [Thermodesulfobacteriota bacterium]
MPKQIVIKKYSNRRLYDTEHKKYITLVEISNLIRDGNEIKVIDSQTGDDITKIILIQVIWESEKNKQDMLPSSFLHMLIKYGNKIAKEFFENYFFMMLRPYMSFQEKMGGNIKSWPETGWFPPGFNVPNFPGMPDMEAPTDSPLEEEAKNSFNETTGEPEPSKENDSPPFSAVEMDVLREKIKELEEKFEELNKPEKTRSKKL